MFTFEFMLKLMCIQIKHTVNLINCLNLLDPTNIVVFANAWIPREKYDPNVRTFTRNALRSGHTKHCR